MDIARETSDLALNPGVPRRRPASAWRCFLWSAGVSLTITVALFLYYVPWRTFKSVQNPHAWVYQNVTTLDEVSDRSTVVQPLIDNGQLFDIIASVWVRDGPIQTRSEQAPEKLVFSDVIFRRMTLKDKGRMTKVNFQVPTSIFKDSETLSNFDLRGSFTLIPSSESLLDNVVDFVSWIPSSVLRPPVRPSRGRQLTLYDQVIDQYGIHVPLVEFHSIKTCCTNANLSRSEARPPTKDNGEETPSQKDTQNDTFIFRTNENFTKLEGHPYLVTRSHLRVIDFTRILNFEEFNQTHHKFSQRSCGQGTMDVEASWLHCLESDTFSSSSLWKTALLKLGIPEASSRDNKTEWAYAPYFSAVKNARGPLDLIPVPVNRENCKDLSSPNEGAVDITWKITYSGRTPTKIWLGDKLATFSDGQRTNMSDAKEVQRDQLFSEVNQGIYGHRHSEGAHPRWYFGAFMLRVFANPVIIKVLDLLYWYTRVGTIGISLSGIILVAASDVATTASSGILNAKVTGTVPDASIWFYLGVILFTLGPYWIILNVMKVKVMMRLQLQWRGLFPKIEKLPATHAERSSMRIDAKLSWVVKILGTLFLSFVYVYATPAHSPENDSTLFRTAAMMALVSCFTEPLRIMGIISQIVLNYRSYKFASMYKLTAVIMLFDSLLWFLPFDFLLSTKSSNTWGPNSLKRFISICADAVLAYQALRYPYPKYEAGDLNEE